MVHEAKKLQKDYRKQIKRKVAKVDYLYQKNVHKGGS